MAWIAGVAGFRRRQYTNYDAYLQHQRSKRSVLEQNDFLDWYHPLLRYGLTKRLAVNPHVERRSAVLCLAARTGAECEAFRQVGCHAIGVDLEPMGDFVMYGDFHHLPFRANSFEIAYTNSLDHVYRPHRFLREVRRIASKIFILEVGGGGPQKYESFAWDSLRSVVKMIVEAGFEVLGMKDYDEPFGGVQITARMP